MVIVDTSVWIDYINGKDTPQTNWLDDALSSRQIGITSLSLCEILQGARTPSQFSDLLRELLKLNIVEIGSAELAIASAENYTSLRRRGITVRSTIDSLIATFCIREGHSLLHKDHDFDAFERHCGLMVQNTAIQN